MAAGLALAKNYGNARAEIYWTTAQAGEAAAARVAAILTRRLRTRDTARILAATGNSQLAFIQALIARSDIEWPRVELFHMDEYAGISSNHPASFRLWIRTRLAKKLPFRSVQYLNGDAIDLPAELERYTRLLDAASLDVAFVGFGENGHIAFNDPPVADFDDPLTVKLVKLDSACRRQQVGEGHFPHPEAVPAEALTVTCSALFRAEEWVCVVPESRKAEATRAALEGPITERCPASLARRHPAATVYLDRESSALLTNSQSPATRVQS